MDAVMQHEHYKDVTAQTVNERGKEYILYCQKNVCYCCMRLLTLWSHDRLVRSILRVLEGDDGEDTHLSGTSGTEKQQCQCQQEAGLTLPPGGTY